MNSRSKTSAAPEAIPFSPPRFETDDPLGYTYLEEHGYAVFKNVLNQTEVEQGRNLAWDFLEGISDRGISRKDPSTWNNWPDPYGKGIVAADGVGHSEFLWFARGSLKVQSVFKRIWNTEALATSFDGFGVHRPFEYNENWKTATGWYHVDQNGLKKPDKICIQGLVNFYDSGAEDGGLVVVPDSNQHFKRYFENRRFTDFKNVKSDFIRLDKVGSTSIWSNEIRELKPIKVNAMAGDLLLWDSRTIHCNSPATTARPLPPNGEVLTPRRLVAYVCMTPMERLGLALREKRKDAYYNGHTTSHWPEECNVNGRKNYGKNNRQVDLSDSQRALIPLPPKEGGSKRKRNDDKGEEEGDD